MNKTLHILFFGVLFILSSLGSRAQVLFSETFSSGTLPAGWTNDSLGVTPLNVWMFNNPFTRIITGAAFDANFAIFDSDEGSVNDGVDELASLTSPSINISAANGQLFLEMDEQYRALSGPFNDGSSRKIEYSSDGGTTWNTLVYDSTDFGYPNPAVHSQYDLSALVGVATNVKVRLTWTGSWDWWWAVDNFQIINLSPCIAPPNAGTAVSDFPSVCPADSVRLSLSGADVAAGLTYQWQSSPNNTSWTDITGATNSSYKTVQSTSTYYRCNLTCSGQMASSVEVQVTMNGPTNCYCTPIYSSGCDAIAKVAINTLYNESLGCNGNPNYYIHYPDTGTATTSLEQGLAYTFTLASGPGSGTHGASVWFDFDQNGDFQGTGEYFHITDTIPEQSADFTANILIPPGAVLGSTRMRVRYIYNHIMDVTDDCSTTSFGETEDYTVHIILPVGINETILNQVSVYPSPVNSQLNIKLGQLKGTCVVSVLDIMGQTLLSSTVVNQPELKFDCTPFAGGIYFVRIENALGSVTKKIIVNN